MSNTADERRARIDRVYEHAELTLARQFGPPCDEEAYARVADEILCQLAHYYETAVIVAELVDQFEWPCRARRTAGRRCGCRECRMRRALSQWRGPE